MMTLNSIDLNTVDDQCFAINLGGYCGVLVHRHEACGTADCPFYKPKSCKGWIRIEDEQGVWLIPPEEYRDLNRRRNEQGTGFRK